MSDRLRVGWSAIAGLGAVFAAVWLTYEARSSSALQSEMLKIQTAADLRGVGRAFDGATIHLSQTGEAVCLLPVRGVGSGPPAVLFDAEGNAVLHELETGDNRTIDARIRSVLNDSESISIEAYLLR